MRIVIATQYYHPAYALGGSVGNAVALAEGLAVLGHAVTVVTTTVVDLSRRPARRGRTERVNGVTVHYLGTWMNLRKTQVNPGVLRLAYLNPMPFDVLHVVGLYDSIGPTLAHLARRRRVPYVVEPAGMLVAGTRSHCAKRIYHLAVGRRMLDRAAAIVVTSRKERDDAIVFGCDPQHLEIRRNGVDVAPYRGATPTGRFRRELGIAPGCPLVLFLGRIDPMKNLGQLLEALSGLGERPWHLALVGPIESPGHQADLDAQAQHLGIASRVSWIGPRYADQKREALADADLVALVSLSENWGNVVQEAIAAGVPVLVTDTCGVAELVGDRAGLVVTLDVPAIRSGLERLLYDESLRAHVRANLPDIAEGLRWDGPVGFMSMLFERLSDPGKADRR